MSSRNLHVIALFVAAVVLSVAVANPIYSERVYTNPLLGEGAAVRSYNTGYNSLAVSDSFLAQKRAEKTNSNANTQKREVEKSKPLVTGDKDVVNDSVVEAVRSSTPLGSQYPVINPSNPIVNQGPNEAGALNMPLASQYPVVGPYNPVVNQGNEAGALNMPLASQYPVVNPNDSVMYQGIVINTPLVSQYAVLGPYGPVWSQGRVIGDVNSPLISQYPLVGPYVHIYIPGRVIYSPLVSQGRGMGIADPMLSERIVKGVQPMMSQRLVMDTPYIN